MEEGDRNMNNYTPDSLIDSITRILIAVPVGVLVLLVLLYVLAFILG
jgi:hypothetical protein